MIQISRRTGLSEPTTLNKFSDIRFSINAKTGGVYLGNKYEQRVSEKITEFGIENKLMPLHHIYDIKLKNGLRIDVRGSSHALHPPSQYSEFFHFRGNDKSKEYCDFFICYIEPFDVAYVIPSEEVKDYIKICYPPLKKSKFDVFRENYKQLVR